MNKFEIAGKNGFIRIEFNEVFGFPKQTSYLGGYDVEGKIEIKSRNYYVKEAKLWFSTGQVYEFFIRIQECYNLLKGNATFSDSENNLEFSLSFIKLGHIHIQGRFQELGHEENILKFEFESDQSYLSSTLQQLKNIVEHYGDLKGVKNK
ncbi:WapI family immunity protein [Aneurinibacillus tyrosinisolvens]|uniref:WapI family immunity protein n=1 Tax=Aneurinibacillus tyrosinisolvens TaxID=1443435 RepID=UPI00063EF596|nr:hypothetical protein [Aneurinibacillus tyrosinisolvens]